MDIIGINRDLSSISDGMGDRYLILDTIPDARWCKAFNEYYENYFSPSKRATRIKDNCIVVNCPLDEIQTQIDQIRGALVYVDKSYAESLAKEEARIVQEESDKERQREKVNSIFDNLKF